MSGYDFRKRAMNVLRGATDMGSDAHQTTPIKEVEENLESHVQTELDSIWAEEGDKPDEEWERIEEGIIQTLPDALEEFQDEVDLDFYDKRVLNQFDEL